MAIRINISANVTNIPQIRQKLEKQLQGIRMSIDATVKGAKTGLGGFEKETTMIKQSSDALNKVMEMYKRSGKSKEEFLNYTQQLASKLNQETKALQENAKTAQSAMASRKKELLNVLSNQRLISEAIDTTTRKEKEAFKQREIEAKKILYQTQLKELTQLTQAYKDTGGNVQNFAQKTSDLTSRLKENEQILKQLGVETTQLASKRQQTESKVQALIQNTIKLEAQKREEIRKTAEARKQEKTVDTAMASYKKQLDELRSISTAYVNGKISAESFVTTSSKVLTSLNEQSVKLKELGVSTDTLKNVNKSASDAILVAYQKQNMNLSELAIKYKQSSDGAKEFKATNSTIAETFKQQEAAIKQLGGNYQGLSQNQKQYTDQIKNTLTASQQATKQAQDLINSYKAKSISISDFITKSRELLATYKNEQSTLQARIRLSASLESAEKKAAANVQEAERAKQEALKRTNKLYQESVKYKDIESKKGVYDQQVQALNKLNKAFINSKVSSQGYSDALKRIATNIKENERNLKTLGISTSDIASKNKILASSQIEMYRKQLSSLDELLIKFKSEKISGEELLKLTNSYNVSLKEQEAIIKQLGGSTANLAQERKNAVQGIQREVVENQKFISSEQQKLTLASARNKLLEAAKTKTQAPEIKDQQLFNEVTKQNLELFKARKISAQEYMQVLSQLQAQTKQYGQIDNQVAAQNARNMALIRNAQERVRNGQATQNDLLLLGSNKWEQMSGSIRGAVNNMGMIIKKFADWIIVAQLVFLPLRTIQDAVKTITEMDDSLTDLNKVVELSKSQLNDMRSEAIQLGKEMGISATEILRGMAEFGRVAKIKEDIIELTRVATIASNVTTMTADEAAKAINSTLITFKKDVSEAAGVIDSFNEIQNNFR